MLVSPVPGLANHAKTLLGPRTRGSTTVAGLDALPPDRKVVEVLEVPDGIANHGCRYFKVDAPELGGKRGAVRLSQALAVGWAVKARAGQHGPELVAVVPDLPVHRKALAELTVADTNVYLVLGPVGEYDGFPEGVLYTWHPGELLAVLSPATGVKLS